MLGHARDVRTGADGGAPTVLAEDHCRILASPMREILEISTLPDRPATQKLVGVRAGGQSRIMLADVMADEKAAGTPLYLLLDDFAGASLVAGWIWSQWSKDWGERMLSAGGADRAAHIARMTNVCTGFAAGSSALRNDGVGTQQQSSTEVVSLRNPDDPEGWHVLFDHPKVSMRRARWIDVWRDGNVIRAEVGFQDSGLNPKGGRTAVHEYLVSANISADDLVLRDLWVHPRILPFPECPGAAAKAQLMVGQRLPDFRSAVLDTLPGTMGCTHLNDVLRSMAEIPQLVAQL
jgi:hypothetical protein